MPDHQSHTTVLIVGGGYAGLAASVFLSAHGVPSVLADRHPAGSVQGRARGINQRTMELEEANRQLQQRNQMLRKMALTDELTGLPNRRAIDRIVTARGH